MKNVSIKRKLQLVSLAVILGYTFIVATVLWSLRKIDHLNDVVTSIHKVENIMLQLRRDEKDFIAREVSNPAFFETKESKYLTAFQSNVLRIDSILSRLQTNQFLTDSTSAELKKMKRYVATYDSLFQQIAVQVEVKGFKDYGLTGAMRNAIHDVEQRLAGLGGYDNFMVQMLMLRRHEKDFMLRQDLRYVEEFHERIGIFADQIKRSNIAQKEPLLRSLDNYEKRFYAVVDISKMIGLSPSEGLMGQMRHTIHQVEPSIVLLATNATQIINSNHQFTVNTLIMTCGLFAVFTYMASTLLGNSIIKSVNLTNRSIEKVSQGDLAVSITVKNHDELSNSLTNFKAMVRKLKEVILAVTQGAENIKASSELLDNASQNLNQQAHDQSVVASNLVVAMEQMSATIDNNTNNAVGASDIAKEVYDSIVKGNEIVQATEQALKKIDDKLKVINDIARQTNILALNASVEAANAGAQGRGFAVVASEVRKLAERTQVASQEIGQLVQTSVHVSKEASAELGNIIPKVEKTSRMLNEIRASSGEQRMSTSQINHAIQQLSLSTQITSATSKETAANAEELSGQAFTLLGTVKFFSVGRQAESLEVSTY